MDRGTKASRADRTRERILAAIRADPGLTLTELRRATRAGWGTLYHHVPGMERDGLVRVQKHRKFRVVFLSTGSHVPGERGLPGRTRRKVAMAVAQLGAATATGLEEATGLTRRVVYHHLKALRDAGWVERTRDERSFTATPKLRALLDKNPGIDPAQR